MGQIQQLRQQRNFNCPHTHDTGTLEAQKKHEEEEKKMQDQMTAVGKPECSEQADNLRNLVLAAYLEQRA